MIKEIQLAFFSFFMIHGIVTVEYCAIDIIVCTYSHGCAVSIEVQDLYIAVKIKAAEGPM